MNLYQRLVITIFGLGLAVLVLVGTQILYTGESVPVIAFQHSDGSEFTLILKEGALTVWRIIGNALWIILVAAVGLIWAAPLKRNQRQ